MKRFHALLVLLLLSLVLVLSTLFLSTPLESKSRHAGPGAVVRQLGELSEDGGGLPFLLPVAGERQSDSTAALDEPAAGGEGGVAPVAPQGVPGDGEGRALGAAAFPAVAPCDMSRCAADSPGTPLLYVIVPFKNRLDNLARMVSSLNNATAPADRSCVCIVVSDFDTEAPSGPSASCLTRRHPQLKIQMNTGLQPFPLRPGIGMKAFAQKIALPAKPTLPELAERLRLAQQCAFDTLQPLPLNNSEESSGARAALEVDAQSPQDAPAAEAEAAALEESPHGWALDGLAAPLWRAEEGDVSSYGDDEEPLVAEGAVRHLAANGGGGAPTGPLHPAHPSHPATPGTPKPASAATPELDVVDLSGLTGLQAIQRVLSLYAGPTMIVDALAYVRKVARLTVKESTGMFSRAGGIQAGLDAITTDPAHSLVFICDADMVVRPGYLQEFILYTDPSLMALASYHTRWRWLTASPPAAVPQFTPAIAGPWLPPPQPFSFQRLYGGASFPAAAKSRPRATPRPLLGPVYYPIVWSLCWGHHPLAAAPPVPPPSPRRPAWIAVPDLANLTTLAGLNVSALPQVRLRAIPAWDAQAKSDRGGGFWRSAGYGMVVAWLSDLRAVGGLSEMVTRAKWGGEDNRLMEKLAARAVIVRRRAPHLLHLFHARVTDANAWKLAGADGKTFTGLGPFSNGACMKLGTCACPRGTTEADIRARLSYALLRRHD